MKRIFIAVLAVLLIGSFAATAAELSLTADLQDNLSARLRVSNFYTELNLNDDLEFDDLSLGIMANTETPFYGLAQINTDEHLNIDELEIGGGARFDFINNTDLGLELTIRDFNLSNFEDWTFNLIGYFAVNFNIFPTPPKTA